MAFFNRAESQRHAKAVELFGFDPALPLLPSPKALRIIARLEAAYGAEVDSNYLGYVREPEIRFTRYYSVPGSPAVHRVTLNALSNLPTQLSK